ncbi:MAG: glycosyltransferase family 39 protein [Candidatus Aenigmarchaeota archaeon]|nr:glycosyltransferase family 39 protein [Candidatus Aenigmarchaeota archaeon]
MKLRRWMKNIIRSKVQKDAFIYKYDKNNILPKKTDSNSKKYYIILILILLFSFFLRLKFFIGAGGTGYGDDLIYSQTAYELSKLNFDKFPIYINVSLRLMMVLPIAFFYSILGVSDFSTSIYPLLCSLGTIILTFYLGKLLFNEKVGLMASFFLSIIPLDVVFSTQLIPRVPLTFFMMLSIYSFLRTENSKNKKYNKLYLFFSGIFAGLGYLANEAGLLIIFVFIAYFIAYRKLKIKYIFILFGFLIIFSIESIFFYTYTNDLFWRARITNDILSKIGTNTDMLYYPRVLFAVKDFNFCNEGHFGLFFFFSIFSILYLLLVVRKSIKKMEIFFLVLWYLFILLYSEFGIMAVNFRPIEKWINYLIIILPPIMLLISYSLNVKGIFNRMKIPFFVLLILTSFYFLYNNYECHKMFTEDFKLICNFLKEQDKKTIYTDFESSGFLNLYFGYEREIKIIENTQENEITDSYVIINSSKGIAIQNKKLIDNLPEFLKNPPGDWILIKVISGSNISIYSLFDPQIYYVP